MNQTKLRRFGIPVIQQTGPVDPAIIKDLRELGLRCLGPYHNDKWYIFLPKVNPSGFTGKHNQEKGVRP
jgi:hypothetical protein